MRTFFSPRHFSSIDEIRGVSIMAVSDTTIDGADVFGYIGEEIIFADYVYDETSEEFYAVPCLSGE